MRAGLERIRRFSIAVWVLGTVVVAVIALVVLPQIAVNPQTGDVYVGTDPDDDYWPWLEEDPQEYEIVDGVLEGTAEGGYLRLDADSEMLMLSNTEGVGEADWVRLYQQQGTGFDVEAEPWLSPDYIGSLYAGAEILVLPGDEDGLLWFGASLTDWTATVTNPEVVPMGETATGQGNAVLMYEGEALSGRFRHTGTGLFLVAAVTVGDWQSLVNDVDDVDVRASWPPSDRVVFQIESDTGDGTWSIELDTPAGSTPPASTPAATPTQ